MTGTSDRLADQIITLLGDEDLGESSYLVLAALEGDEALADALDGQYTPPEPAPADEVAPPEPVGAFLGSISVAGFRGIGHGETLRLHPAPGLTVVAGRNGSGKSTYAEALEVALTSNSYRWRARAAAWQRNWANLHTPRPREIRLTLAEDGVGATTVGVDWPADAEQFKDLRCWVQRPGHKREAGLQSLGWADAIDLYRPILSYEELGGLLTDAPSKLYDALVAILGLDRVADAQKRLDAANSHIGAPVKQAKAERAELKKILGASDDARAAQAATLLRKHVPDLDALRRLATGSGSGPTEVLGRLRELAELPLPDRELIRQAARELRTAVGAVAAHLDTTTDRADRRLALLREAIDLHAVHGGDIPCPVCGHGVLDDAWRAAVQAELVAESAAARARHEARQQLRVEREAAHRLVTAVGMITSVPGVELATVERAAAARSAWAAAPQDDMALAEHLATRADELHAAVTGLRAEAAAVLQAREDAWTPLATRLAAWLELAGRARAAEPQVENVQHAGKWLREHASQLRNQQLEPLATEARQVWAELRQESNVDLKAITVSAPNPKLRHVEIGAEVDGADAGALGVMSTGELHALALALFLPRATRPESPFRFVVLDDPIQAMDPSKIDGFVRVLATLAATRQVVVFSHDDRLPEAVRRLVPGARLIEVNRSARSAVTVTDAEDPARRDIEDAFALLRDDGVDPEIRRRILPGLCRSAVETAARDAWFARAHSTGRSRESVESSWAEARNQPQRIALALYGDVEKPLDKWLDGAPYRRAALQVVGRDLHGSVRRDPRGAVRDVERLIADLRTGAR